MEKSTGLKLIEELYYNPYKFYDKGRSYQLLQEYFRGFSLETLRPLLADKEPWVRRVAVWIVSELGVKASNLINEAIPLIYDEERYVKYHALEIVFVCSVNENADKFILIIPFLDDCDSVIRILAMRLISNADPMRLKAGMDYFGSKGSYYRLHVEGLTMLLDVENLTSDQVVLMVNSNEPLLRKYGIMAAKSLFSKFPNLINDATTNEDHDIREFSNEVIDIYAH